ncbi:MAG: hypothetical protein SH821_17895 [Phototrophicales bacterium]|nr:hypothetical protein [Phototrophicales bacterium]
MVNKQTSNEDLLQLAIKAAKEGQKEGARVMFRQIHSRDKRNETTIMWLAKIATTEKERISWLTKALELNPTNDTAKKALEKMNYRDQANQNKTLLLFGGIAAFMIITVIVVVIIISTAS